MEPGRREVAEHDVARQGEGKGLREEHRAGRGVDAPPDPPGRDDEVAAPQALG